MVNRVTTTMMNVRFGLASNPIAVVPFRRAVLPIPGTVPVAVVVSGDEASCQRLGARLFSVSPEQVDIAMMEDTLREIANITAGQVKQAMRLDQALGLPRILNGQAAWAEAPSSRNVRLKAMEDDVMLEVLVTSHLFTP